MTDVTCARAEIQRRVRLAARALAGAGLVHAYGHCSARLDAGRFLVCAAKPMGIIAPGESGVVVPVSGPLPEGVLGEVRIHQQIYARRPEVGGVCRIMPSAIMALSLLRRTPRPWHGNAAFFAPSPPLWDSPLLARDDTIAGGIAETLGNAKAVVMRGNGAVTAGDSLEAAVTWAWFLEDAARIESFLIGSDCAGDAVPLSPEEVEARSGTGGGVVERMWAYLTHGDPEA